VKPLRAVFEAELYAADGTEGNDWDAIAPGMRELVYLVVKRAVSAVSGVKDATTHV
jgi:hypothetical protein